MTEAVNRRTRGPNFRRRRARAPAATTGGASRGHGHLPSCHHHQLKTGIGAAVPFDRVHSLSARQAGLVAAMSPRHASCQGRPPPTLASGSPQVRTCPSRHAAACLELRSGAGRWRHDLPAPPAPRGSSHLTCDAAIRDQAPRRRDLLTPWLGHKRSAAVHQGSPPSGSRSRKNGANSRERGRTVSHGYTDGYMSPTGEPSVAMTSL